MTPFTPADEYNEALLNGAQGPLCQTGNNAEVAVKKTVGTAAGGPKTAIRLFFKAIF